MLRDAALAKNEQLEGKFPVLSPWEESPRDSAWMPWAIYPITQTH